MNTNPRLSRKILFQEGKTVEPIEKEESKEVENKKTTRSPKKQPSWNY